jgi:V8-like Glu-specific endopeptidase
MQSHPGTRPPFRGQCRDGDDLAHVAILLDGSHSLERLAIGGDGDRASANCCPWRAGAPWALAQLAPPSGRPTGILGVLDHRVQIAPDKWPWSSIGRINIVGISSRGWCTGTLIAPRRVLTAAHCLFSTRTNDWVKPGSLHFVVGQARDKFLGHSPVESFSTSPEFRPARTGQ